MIKTRNDFTELYKVYKIYNVYHEEIIFIH